MTETRIATSAAGAAPAGVADAPAATLLVLYTEQLEACREFYADLGLRLVREQHGSGPVHYAADLGSLVLELYPAQAGQTTGRMRLGLTVPAAPNQELGQQKHTDPDGRVVVLAVAPRPA